MEGFSAKSGAVAFHNDLRFDLGRIFGDFSAGARRRAGAAAVAGAQRKIASLRDVWDLCPRAPFRFGKRGRDCSYRTASFQVECASWWGCEQVGSRGPNDGIVIFCRRPWGRRLSRLLAAARHGSSGAQTAGMAEGAWMARECRRNGDGICAGSAGDSNPERLGVVDRLLRGALVSGVAGLSLGLA